MLGAMAKPAGTRKKKEEPARARRARSVSEMLPEIGGAAFRRFGFVQSSIVSRWREIVGERYAAVSAPESIRFPPGKRSAGVLTLVVEGAHAPVMQHVAPTIIERVNRFFGYSAVDRVSFRQGIVRVEKEKARTLPAPLEPVPASLGDSLRAVGDPELKACLEALARSVVRGDELASIPVIGTIGEKRR
jgi:hypothetical protein